MLHTQSEYTLKCSRRFVEERQENVNSANMHIHSLYECECLNMMCRSENKNRLKDSRCNLVQHFDISPYFDVSAPDVAISLKMEHLMRFEFTFYLQNL